MKKLYTRFFHIPKHEKIGEKVMLTRVATTIATIVVCLIAMSLTAYAYFSCDVTSGSNVIKAAKFDAQITITDERGNLVEPSAKEGKISTFAFTVPGNYTVTLSPKKEDSTAQTGFCVVYVGNDTYHTQQIGVDVLAKNQNRESVSFTLQVKGAETVKIESHWGTSSHYDYTDNNFYIVESKPLKVIVVGTAANSGTDTNEVTSTTTTITETSVAKTTETTTVETTTFPQTTSTTETTVETTNATETTTSVTTANSTTVTTESNITEQTEPTGETTTATAGAPTTKGG